MDATQVLTLKFKHMSKCAGTEIAHLLRAATRGGHAVPFQVIGETFGVTAARRRGAFVIASVRNPCDYYVSLWAYQHRKPWARRQSEASRAASGAELFEHAPRHGLHRTCTCYMYMYEYMCVCTYHVH